MMASQRVDIRSEPSPVSLWVSTFKNHPHSSVPYLFLIDFVKITLWVGITAGRYKIRGRVESCFPLSFNWPPSYGNCNAGMQPILIYSQIFTVTYFPPFTFKVWLDQIQYTSILLGVCRYFQDYPLKASFDWNCVQQPRITFKNESDWWIGHLEHL